MGARGEGQARGRGRDVNAQCPDVSPWPGQSGRQLISLRRSDGCDRLSTVDEIRGEDRLAVIRCVFSSSSSPTSLLSPPHPAAMLIYNQTADKISLLLPSPHHHCHSHRGTPYHYHHYHHHRRHCAIIIFFFRLSSKCQRSRRHKRQSMPEARKLDVSFRVPAIKSESYCTSLFLVRERV